MCDKIDIYVFIVAVTINPLFGVRKKQLCSLHAGLMLNSNENNSIRDLF